MLDQKEWLFNCPHCGKDKRLVQQIVDDDRIMGRLDVVDGAMSIQELPIRSNTKNYGVGDEISVLLVFNDICSGCGTVYIFKVLRNMEKMRKDVSRLVLPKGAGVPPKLNRNN